MAVKKYKTRTPKILTRGVIPNIPTLPEPPQKKERKPRCYIPASMPTICPKCGHSTRMADGRHVDPVRKKILEYRTCSKCGKKLAAGRDMTASEVESLCSRAEAVQEYEKSQ